MFLLKNFSALRRPAFSLLAGGLLAFTAASAEAQVSKSGTGYLMRVKYTKGQILKYKSVNKMVAPGQAQGAMDVGMPLTLKVADVKNGKANIKATVGPVTMNGSQLQPAQTADMTVDTRNQASSKASSQMMGAQLPVGAVKVGQTWTTTAPLPAMAGGSQTMKAVYKFQGLKTFKGKTMAVITYSLSGGATGTGTMLLLASDGTLYSNDAKISVSTGGAKMNVESKMFRV